MARLREELRVRLLDMEHQHAATAMRHLIFVHDVLGRQGWAGVQAMNSSVLRKAIVQVQMLIEREPSNRLGRLADKLRMLQAAAEAREERAQAHALRREEGGAAHADTTIEVSEASAEEYEASQREWNATMPAELDALPSPEEAKAEKA